MCGDVSEFPDGVQKPQNPPIQKIIMLKQLQAVELLLFIVQMQTMVPKKGRCCANPGGFML